MGRQHRQELVGDAHQIAQIGDRMLSNRRFDQAQRLKAPTRSQCRCGFLNILPEDARQHGIGFLRACRFAIDQYGSQFALVAAQRGMQQDRALADR